jgi:teichuronic acid biosynthesis glycosyltransferase TuaG
MWWAGHEDSRRRAQLGLRMIGAGPLVSVVIPTYNHANFLRDALRSIEAQTYRPLEIVVVDNFSSDDTEAVVGEFAHLPLSYVKFANGGIIAASRNVGIRETAGEYVAFLDADDTWAPDKIAQQVGHLRDPSVAGVASGLRYTGALAYAPSGAGRGEGGVRDYRYNEIVRANPVATSSVLVRRKDLDRVGGFDEAPEFRIIEDWELWLRLTVDGTFRVVQQPLVTYRIALQERSRLPILANKLKVLEKHVRLGFLDSVSAADAEAEVRFSIGVAAYADDAKLARESFRAASRLTQHRRRGLIAWAARMSTHLPRAARVTGLNALRWANRQARFE